MSNDDPISTKRDNICFPEKKQTYAEYIKILQKHIVWFRLYEYLRAIFSY